MGIWRLYKLPDFLCMIMAEAAGSEYIVEADLNIL